MIDLVSTVKIVFIFLAYLEIIGRLSANTRRKKTVFTPQKVSVTTKKS